jgi:hypothetical protein
MRTLTAGASTSVARARGPCEDGAGMRSSTLVLLCIVVAGAACRGERKRGHVQAPAATLIGRVRLAEGVPLPAYTALDMARKLLHGGERVAVPDECATANAAALQPVTLAADRALAGVVIAASDFTRAPRREPETHAIEIHGCRLQPPIVAAMFGDRITLENRDPFPFEPLIGPAYGARSLPIGRKIALPIGPGVDSIRCSTRAPCGRSDLVVFYHPVFAVSDARGEFRIDNFPAAELVRISVWHPLFEESQTFVWVDPGTTSAVDFVLEPKLRFLPPAPQAPGAATLHSAAGR